MCCVGQTDDRHLLPATLGLARLEIDLVSMTQREFQLRRAVTQLATSRASVESHCP